nr:MAG TPA: hypothetical protein [Bacteriophage sp.]
MSDRIFKMAKTLLKKFAVVCQFLIGNVRRERKVYGE